MFKDLEMTDSEYDFKLDSYPNHVKEVLKEMVTDSVFSDVTLVFDDLQIMKANRNVFSMHAVLFSGMFCKLILLHLLFFI